VTPEEMAALHARCFQTAPRPWTADEFRDAHQHPAQTVLSTAGGLAVISLAGDEAELLTICISPERRNEGAGRALLALAEQKAGDLGARTMVLEVAESNAAACALYSSAGYEQAGFRRDYYRLDAQERISALVLRRYLG